MTKIVKFHPANKFAEDITGANGCANCGHGIVLGWEQGNNVAVPKWRHKIEGGDAVGEFCDAWDRIRLQTDGLVRQCACPNPQPRKQQTIRAKPIEIGTKIALWEMYRGMKKGRYCPNFWGDCEFAIKTKYADACSFCGRKLVQFPRKLGEAVIKECVPIEMRWDSEDVVMDIRVNGQYLESIEPDSPLGQSAFVAKDTPGWDNRRFVDFFLATYPEMKTGWKKMFIWKW